MRLNKHEFNAAQTDNMNILTSIESMELNWSDTQEDTIQRRKDDVQKVIRSHESEVRESWAATVAKVREELSGSSDYTINQKTVS